MMTMGHSRGESMFQWAPVRPSYLPASHPSSETRGAACSEGCRGRRGDEEILEMYNRCRRNPEGWTQIPCSPNVGKFVRASKPAVPRPALQRTITTILGDEA